MSATSRRDFLKVMGMSVIPLEPAPAAAAVPAARVDWAMVGTAQDSVRLLVAMTPEGRMKLMKYRPLRDGRIEVLDAAGGFEGPELR